MQVVGGAHEVAPRRKVGRVHHERLPLPSSQRISLPQAYGCRQVRALVETDDARLVDRLEEQDDMSRRLHDLVVAERSGPGVGAADSRHAISQAPLDVSEIFGSFKRTPANLI